MAHEIEYIVNISGDDQGRIDVKVSRHQTLESAREMEQTLGVAGFDAFIEGEVINFDENMVVNQMMHGGWGDHCFGELFRTKKNDSGDNIYDYKKCLFYKGADASHNTPLAWLSQADGVDGEYIWRLLPDGVEHYRCNYMTRGPAEDAISSFLDVIFNERKKWMVGYEARRL